MSPIHVRGKQGEVAERVLLPGDPGRAEWIAQTFLEEPRLYTSHRGLLGFTGRYRGVPVSVQTTGMGAPSASIVAEELVSLGARVLLRVGTCGAVDEGLSPGDLVIAQGAVSLDGATRQYLEGRPYAPVPDAELFRALWKQAEQRGYPHHVGLVATEDAFYATTPEGAKAWAQFGLLAFEMEATPLHHRP
ncbi:purine-nucleoside phosphorylase [Thermus scotoductus]|uniref:Uridine phosphorylase n=1 Tax=Thermus scotoductus TaxID=37636 RepID=A0A430RLK1_THESC|nr:purine-nucleoside phosphorylase [Thermus scotoductus]